MRERLLPTRTQFEKTDWPKEEIFRRVTDSYALDGGTRADRKCASDGPLPPAVENALPNWIGAAVLGPTVWLLSRPLSRRLGTTLAAKVNRDKLSIYVAHFSITN